MKKPYKKPPVIIRKLLKSLVKKEEYESLIGDLDEMYSLRTESEGRLRACFWYFFQIMKLSITVFSNSIQWSSIMFKNYLLIALRNLKRQKIYSLINIFGLALGIACFTLIFLFIRDELSYDRYHEKANRIYRLVDSFDRAGGVRELALSSAPFAPTLEMEFPEVEDAVRTMPRRFLVKRENQKFYEENLVWADASIF